MAHVIYIDKQDNFECNLELEGASFNDTVARLLIETPNYNLLFNGTINEMGTVKVPISSVKRVFPSETHGKIRLEVIAEDTYFSPWEDEVILKPSKTLAVESIKLGEKVLSDQKKDRISVSNVKTINKPIPEVSKPQNINELIEPVASVLKSQNITKKAILQHRDLIPVVENVIKFYFSKYNMTVTNKLYKEIIDKL